MIPRLPFLLLLAAMILTGTLYGQTVERLGFQVNSDYEEREPILSPDGSTLFFWRRETPANTAGLADPGDIWYSRILRDGSFAPAIRMSQPLNSMGHDFIWQVSEFGDTLWMNQAPSGSKIPGLSYSVRKGRGYSSPRPARIQGFSYKGNYKDYYLTREKIMLIPNEGEDSYGGTDIYVCFPINALTWSKPINLGPVINTFGDDDAAFMAEDGKTLFFNSNGHGGYGDHDVFMSRRLDDTWQNWSEPVNVGPPINTAGYDFDFIVSEDGKYAYWCSDSEKYGDNDIFRMDLQACNLRVFPEGDMELCEGEEVMLETGFSLSQDVIGYQWYKNNRPIAGATNRSLRVTQSGRYHVKRVKLNCVETSPLQDIKFVPSPQAQLLVPGKELCLSDSLRLRAALTQSGISFQWQRNGLDVSEAKERLFWAKSPGEYRIKVSNGSCEAFSESVQLTRFSAPSVFYAQDTLFNSRYRVPRWDWANRLPEQKGDLLVQDIVVNDDKSSFVMSLSQDKRGRIKEHITGYFPGGPIRSEFPSLSTSDASDRFMAVDAEGNLFVTRNEKYLIKYRSDGRVLWQIDASREKVAGIAVDKTGYIYTMGRYSDTLYIEDKRVPATQRGSIYLAKHRPDGALEWIQTLSADWYKYDFGNGLHTDCDGNIYIAGGFRSIANFRKRILRGPLRAESYFLAKYNPKGEFQWARKVSTDRVDFRTCDVSTDCEGNTYMLLNYKLVKYDTHGKLLHEGTLRAPVIPDLARITHSHKDVFITGFNGDKEEVFVTKLDRNNEQVLLWRGKGANKLMGNLPAIASDPDGDVYVAGIAKNDSPPAESLGTLSSSPGFVSKYGRPTPKKQVKPLSLCDSESGSIELLTKKEPGVLYQWYKDFEEIPGATLSSLSVFEPGEYQVKSIMATCELMSPIQVVTECEERPQPAAPVVDNKPVSPYAGDQGLSRGPQGRPVRLKGRRVKDQGEIIVKQAVVKIGVYDYGAYDRDTVSLNVNGKWVLQNYCLQKKKKELEFTFQRGVPNFVILYAHNLGATPPNTASITIDDGIKVQTIKLESNLKNCGTLNVKFQ